MTKKNKTLCFFCDQPAEYVVCSPMNFSPPLCRKHAYDRGELYKSYGDSFFVVPFIELKEEK